MQGEEEERIYNKSGETRRRGPVLLRLKKKYAVRPGENKETFVDVGMRS